MEASLRHGCAQRRAWWTGWVRRVAPRCRRWAEAQPRRAWLLALLLVLLPAAWETARWVRADFPVATWHHDPPGIEVEVVHARARTAGWRELAGYWTGRIIHGNDYYQPLTSWLFVAEYRLFGTDNRRWTWLNVVLHPVCVATLAVVSSLWVSGSRPERLGFGVLVGWLFGAPGLADRASQGWIVCWWPVQPDLFALTLGLLLLAATTQYVRTGDRRLRAVAPLLFFLAVCFKETAYTLGVGACLLLLRHRRRWDLLVRLAASGLLFFFVRWLALGGTLAFGSDNDPGRAVAALRGEAVAAAQAAAPALLPLALLAGACGAAALWGRRRGLSPATQGFLGVGLAFGAAVLLLGPPWEPLFLLAMEPLLRTAVALALLAGLLLALRRWPWPELLAVYAMNLFLALSFPRALGWHGYWSSAFAAPLTAAACFQLGGLVARRLAPRSDSPAETLSGAAPPSPASRTETLEPNA